MLLRSKRSGRQARDLGRTRWSLASVASLLASSPPTARPCAACPPIQEAGIVGAAHAGWRGAVAGVIEATIAAMIELGARLERTVAVVGPCIGQNSYEVAADLRDAVLARSRADARFFAEGKRDAHWQFDLPGYCAARLRAAGVAEAAVTGIDTMTDEERFFSHRRRVLAGGGPIGHQISVIAVA